MEAAGEILLLPAQYLQVPGHRSHVQVLFHHAFPPWCFERSGVTVCCLLFLSVPKGRARWEEPLPVQPDPPAGLPWLLPQGSPRSCLLGGKQLALLSDLHKVIWGICGRAANMSVSVSNTRWLFSVLLLNSPQRSVKLLFVRCFQCNYKVISEASCGV